MNISDSNDWPDDEDYSEDSDEESVELAECPECGAAVYEDAERCPACGEYITPQQPRWAGKPAWWIVLGMLGIAATVLTLALGGLW